jgi:hypothetical protein
VARSLRLTLRRAPVPSSSWTVPSALPNRTIAAGATSIGSASRGTSTGMWCMPIGITTRKMISKTSTTSTSGVMLM